MEICHIPLLQFSLLFLGTCVSVGVSTVLSAEAVSTKFLEASGWKMAAFTFLPCPERDATTYRGGAGHMNTPDQP